MNRTTFKKNVLQDAIKRQQEIINDFEDRIENLRNDVVEEDEWHSDNQELIENYSRELELVYSELEILEKLKVESQFDTVAPGAIVETDRMIFFPSVSIERFISQGVEIFGISEKAPLYQEMKGRKKGEEFRYNGERYKILDLY